MKLLAALLSAAMPGAAVAQSSTCLQAKEAEDLVVFVLPSLLDGMTRRCGPLLPRTAALTVSGSSLAQRYRPDADAAWPNAKTAFVKISGQEKSMGFLSDDVLRGVIQEASTAAIVSEFKAKDCTMIDRFVDALSPLPARNMGKLVALLLEVGAGEAKSPMQICEAHAVR
jgi:hypothetical protein